MKLYSLRSALLISHFGFSLIKWPGVVEVFWSIELLSDEETEDRPTVAVAGQAGEVTKDSSVLGVDPWAPRETKVLLADTLKDFSQGTFQEVSRSNRGVGDCRHWVADTNGLSAKLWETWIEVFGCQNHGESHEYSRSRIFRKDRKEAEMEVLTDLSEECDQQTETFAVAAVQRSKTPLRRRTDLGLVVLSLQLVVGPPGVLLAVQ
jgi:hypothetical protein